METNNSLLNKIRSKYILKKILTIAYGDMKSVFKFTKYNKSLMNKIDINNKNFQDHYQYKLDIKVIKRRVDINYYFIIKDTVIFLLLLIYIILYKVNGKFSLKKGYENKELFVIIMNDYILYIFCGCYFIYFD